jgi:hypothetical protein
MHDIGALLDGPSPTCLSSDVLIEGGTWQPKPYLPTRVPPELGLLSAVFGSPSPSYLPADDAIKGACAYAIKLC